MQRKVHRGSRMTKNILNLFKRECYLFKDGLKLFEKYKNKIILDDDNYEFFDETIDTIMNFGFVWGETREGHDFWCHKDIIVRNYLGKYGSHFKFPCNCKSKFVEVKE